MQNEATKKRIQTEITCAIDELNQYALGNVTERSIIHTLDELKRAIVICGPDQYTLEDFEYNEIAGMSEMLTPGEFLSGYAKQTARAIAKRKYRDWIKGTPAWEL